MKLLRKILFPFVPIYYTVTWLRNLCYDLGWKASKSYNFPVLGIGNLSVGGTGKTPMTEYLIRILQETEDYQVAVLSRGYGRKTKGFRLASYEDSAETIGDEPFQFYTKFKGNVTVAVDENRQHGIDTLQTVKAPEVILLDDAFQHRRVRAGFYILLTSYGHLYSDDIVLPTGDLREPRAGAKRANVIIVTKCPLVLSTSEKEQIIKKLKPLKHQSVYFSSISYSKTIFSADASWPLAYLNDKNVTLVTGIANPSPLVEYLKSKAIAFEHLNFKDHHVFSNSEIEMLKQKPLVLTTEKDYMRLKSAFKSTTSSLYFLPMAFQIENHEAFDAQIISFVKSL